MFEVNPAIKRLSETRASAGGLTYNGVINRTGVLLLATGVSFVLTWKGLQSGAVSPSLGTVGAIVGLVLGLFIAFTRATNPLLIVLYALAQGTMLGTVSFFANERFPGIALQAVAGTLGCFCVVLWLYSLRVLRATPVFVKVVVGAMIGVALLYLVDIVAGFFGHPLAILNGNSGLSIGISGLIVLLAAVSFVLDFAAIERAVAEGADERDGWHFAFALLVGLIWLYIEILRLLTKLRSRD
jgi:uncharacterized YccA/Bax inhibitor family protein